MMIVTFAANRQYWTAYGVFQQLKAAGLRPDKMTYTILIKASIKGGNLDNILDLLDDMKWIGIQPQHHELQQRHRGPAHRKPPLQGVSACNRTRR
jgi:pentatricopeptide repeat protein